jgi:hypothetical protein
VSCTEDRFGEIRCQEVKREGCKETVSGYNQKQVFISRKLRGQWGHQQTWDNIRENITVLAWESPGYCESKHCIPCFDEVCSKLVDRRKQAKLQWLQDPSDANEDNLSDVRREAGRHFGNKKRE